jgi:D-serine deaminase-like pyridoxal phosphate-dependent protein
VIDLASVETPTGCIDVAQVRANARRVAGYCTDHGLAWRPHVKTHKSTDVARIQLEAGARGLTVATPHEAEVMSEVTDDLLLAYPPVGRTKLERLMDLPERVRLTVGLDSETVVRSLAEASRSAGRTTGILVEIDVGMHRVGVATASECVRIASTVAETDGVDYRGIMFYPGHIRVPLGEQDPLLDELATGLSNVLEALDASGLTPQVVSGGSTPTLWHSHRMPGVTEVRAGTCIFNDRDIAQLDACEPQEIAYTVLARVISTAIPGQAVVDAGSKALAKESFRSGGSGFGVLLDEPEITVRALSEEHGVLDVSASAWRPAVGDLVRIVPNHVCVSVNLQDHLIALENDHTSQWSLPGRGRQRYTPA